MSMYYWAECGMYDKVYYRVNDTLSIEMSGDGRLIWYKTNEKTHRMHQSGSEWCSRLPLMTFQRPSNIWWV